MTWLSLAVLLAASASPYRTEKVVVNLDCVPATLFIVVNGKDYPQRLTPDGQGHPMTFSLPLALARPIDQWTASLRLGGHAGVVFLVVQLPDHTPVAASQRTHEHSELLPFRVSGQGAASSRGPAGIVSHQCEHGTPATCLGSGHRLVERSPGEGPPSGLDD